MKDHVQARFGGRDIAFRIAPDYLAVMPAFDMLTRFRNGLWTVGDITKVLSIAQLAEPREPITPDAAQVRVQMAMGLKASPAIAHVQDVLRRPGAGNYAPLAIKVLVAALFGLVDDEAVFSDEDDVATQ